MDGKSKVVVVGLGEVGQPLYTLISEHHEAVGVDVSPQTVRIDRVDVLHICYPFEIRDFAGESARYIELFRPALTIINSTVAVGTTRAIAERTNSVVVHSPVRGKHAHMLDEIRTYTKFIGASDPVAGQQAADHFESLGLKTKILSSPEGTELAKLTETTYFGLLIAWAQEVERYCDQAGQNYDEVVSFFDEIAFFPRVKYLPGVIGGHCVISNIKILGALGRAVMLDSIEMSNEMKKEREAGKAQASESWCRPGRCSRSRSEAL